MGGWWLRGAEGPAQAAQQVHSPARLPVSIPVLPRGGAEGVEGLRWDYGEGCTGGSGCGSGVLPAGCPCPAPAPHTRSSTRLPGGCGGQGPSGMGALACSALVTAVRLASGGAECCREDPCSGGEFRLLVVAALSGQSSQAPGASSPPASCQ